MKIENQTLFLDGFSFPLTLLQSYKFLWVCRTEYGFANTYSECLRDAGYSEDSDCYFSEVGYLVDLTVLHSAIQKANDLGLAENEIIDLYLTLV